MTPELEATLSRSDVWRRLYETDARYRAMWDAGIGPGQRNDRELIHTAKYNHWAPLHWYAVEHAPHWDEQRARAFYRQWQKTIPNTSGCACKAKWKKLGLVPDYFSAKAFFEWSWLAHNTVSERPEINNPTFTLEQAYAIWWPSYQAPLD